MLTKQKRRTNRWRLLVPLLAMSFIGYFGYHAIHGGYGLQSSTKFEARLATLTSDLEALKSDRERWERRVSLLQGGSVERDMLDERSRRYLNVAKADEMIIMIENVK